MAQPFIGEIRMFGGNFPPNGWAFCDGQAMPISENDALFVVIGTTYGGDGEETFNLPNLQSRIPIHQGTGAGGVLRQMGETGGTESVTLTTQQIPIHNHALLASTDTGTAINPLGGILGAGASVQTFRPAAGNSAANSQSITPVGGNQPHDNMQPFLCVNYIISLFGLFPTQN